MRFSSDAIETNVCKHSQLGGAAVAKLVCSDGEKLPLTLNKKVLSLILGSKTKNILQFWHTNLTATSTPYLDPVKGSFSPLE